MYLSLPHQNVLGVPINLHIILRTYVLAEKEVSESLGLLYHRRRASSLHRDDGA